MLVICHIHSPPLWFFAFPTPKRASARTLLRKSSPFPIYMISVGSAWFICFHLSWRHLELIGAAHLASPVPSEKIGCSAPVQQTRYIPGDRGKSVQLALSVSLVRASKPSNANASRSHLGLHRTSLDFIANPILYHFGQPNNPPLLRYYRL